MAKRGTGQGSNAVRNRELKQTKQLVDQMAQSVTALSTTVADLAVSQQEIRDLYQDQVNIQNRFNRAAEERNNSEDDRLQKAKEYVETQVKNLRMQHQLAETDQERCDLQTQYSNAYKAQLQLQADGDKTAERNIRLQADAKRKARLAELEQMAKSTGKDANENKQVLRTMTAADGTTKTVNVYDSMRAEIQTQYLAEKNIGLKQGEKSGGNFRDTASAYVDALKSDDFVSSLTSSFGGAFKASGAMLAFTAITSVLKGINQTIGAIKDKVNQATSEVTSFLDSDSVRLFDSRLYGLMTGTDKLNTNIIQFVEDAITVVGNNSLINTKELVNNIVELGNKGIAYNLEQRALWETLSDKMVATFDVTNATLLELIKVQRTELTDAYMGVEAAITRTLNSMFVDSQYMSDQYTNVLTALTNALASVSSDVGVSLAYQIQKWLGSLSSLGLTENAVNTMATSLGQALSGDLNAMNETGQTMVALAAQQSGISYTDILTQGIQEEQKMNDFMAAMVQVLQNIYESSEGNNVLLQTWGDVFGLEIADWKAIANMSADVISQLKQQNINGMQGAQAETKYIYENLVGERTLASERYANLVENLWFDQGVTIAKSVENYTHQSFWQGLSTILNTTGLGNLGIGGITLSSAVETAAGVSTLLDLLKEGGLSDFISKLDQAWQGSYSTTTMPQTFIGDTKMLSDFYLPELYAGSYVNYSDIANQSFTYTDTTPTATALLNGTTNRAKAVAEAYSKGIYASTANGVVAAQQAATSEPESSAAQTAAEESGAEAGTTGTSTGTNTGTSGSPALKALYTNGVSENLGAAEVISISNLADETAAEQEVAEQSLEIQTESLAELQEIRYLVSEYQKNQTGQSSGSQTNNNYASQLTSSANIYLSSATDIPDTLSSMQNKV